MQKLSIRGGGEIKKQKNNNPFFFLFLPCLLQ